MCVACFTCFDETAALRVAFSIRADVSCALIPSRLIIKAIVDCNRNITSLESLGVAL